MGSLDAYDIAILISVGAFIFQCGMFVGVWKEERWQRQKEKGLKDLEEHKRAVDDLVQILSDGIPAPPIEQEPKDESRYVN